MSALNNLVIFRAISIEFQLLNFVSSNFIQ